LPTNTLWGGFDVALGGFLLSAFCFCRSVALGGCDSMRDFHAFATCSLDKSAPPLTLPGPWSLICGPLSWTALPFNLDYAVEQQSHEDAKVGNKRVHGISPKLVVFTWQVNPNQPSNLPLPGFFSASLLFASNYGIQV
jgi:hypothetical protein